MKSLVTIIALCFLTFQTSYQTKAGAEMMKRVFETHKEVKKQCMDESHVDIKLEAIFEDVAEIQDDEKLRCFTKCLLIVSGAINEAGDPFPEHIARNMQLKDVSLANDLIKECSGYDKVDLCQGAKQLIDCGLKYLETRLSTQNVG